MTHLMLQFHQVKYSTNESMIITIMVLITPEQKFDFIEHLSMLEQHQNQQAQ